MAKHKKWRLSADMDAQADAAKHDVPIASRKYLLQWLEAAGTTMAADAICDALGFVDPRAQNGVERRLRAMERDGQLVCNRAGDFGIASRMDLVRGTVIAHRDGYGFLSPEDGGADLFLSPRSMRALIHGDRALVRMSRSREAGRTEAKLVEVVERNTTHIVGRYFRERGIGFVYPERRVLHQDLLIPPEFAGNAEDGQMVVARLVEQPSVKKRPVGEVIEILGQHMAPGLEIEVAIRAHGIPSVWPASVTDGLDGISHHVEDEQKVGRTDIRKLPLVTIDGVDAKDFDDAVYCKRTPKGWRLVVAIADVGAYVPANSALDEEARARGNSTYFPGQVVPMLPEVLSNGLCSLNPDRERLCMVCDMTISADGEISRSRFYEGLMRSHARLTYDEVDDAVVQKNPEVRASMGPLVGHLDELHALFTALMGARERRGCLEFDTRESQIMFGPDRKIDRIVPVTRNDAHRMIEECMIAANISAAKFLSRRKLPALYRVHQRPKEDKLVDLRAFLGPLGLQLGGGKEPEGHHFASLAKRVVGRDDAAVIQTVMLRSLPQARYTPQCEGHFGLALTHYTHFTSPIRRYSDLIVHRAIKAGIKATQDAWPSNNLDLGALGDECSQTERRSDDATRDVTSWLKCEFMLDKQGEEFGGSVAGVAPFGIFVQLDDVYVEGLVHVSGLGRDYYHFDPVRHRLSAEGGASSYSIGTRVQVRVARVDLDERKIDFELVTPPGGKKEKARTGKRRPDKRRAKSQKKSGSGKR